MSGRSLASLVLSLLSVERGALLWIPSLLVGTYLVLYGIRQAPAELSLFNQTRDLRLLLGPVQSESSHEEQAKAFLEGLQGGLRRHQELSVVESRNAAERIKAMLGEDAADDPRSLIRATRTLNARYYLAMRLEAIDDSLEAQVEIWEVSRAQPVHRVSGRDVQADRLGLALAESLGADLFNPELQRQFESRLP